MRGLREQPARLLANRAWESAGKCSTGRGPVLLIGPRGQWLTENAPCPWQPGPDLPGLQWNWPMKKQVAGRSEERRVGKEGGGGQGLIRGDPTGQPG